jgi:hypothetical protein
MDCVRDGLVVDGEIIAFAKTTIIAAITERTKMHPWIEKVN